MRVGCEEREQTARTEEADAHLYVSVSPNRRLRCQIFKSHLNLSSGKTLLPLKGDGQKLIWANKEDIEIRRWDFSFFSKFYGLLLNKADIWIRLIRANLKWASV